MKNLPGESKLQATSYSALSALQQIRRPMRWIVMLKKEQTNELKKVQTTLEVSTRPTTLKWVPHQKTNFKLEMLERSSQLLHPLLKQYKQQHNRVQKKIISRWSLACLSSRSAIAILRPQQEPDTRQGCIHDSVWIWFIKRFLINTPTKNRYNCIFVY